MLDLDHCGAGVDRRVQLHQKLVHVGRVQSGCRLIEDVQRVPTLCTLQLGGKLDALRFAAGDFQGGLAEPKVTCADALHGFT